MTAQLVDSAVLLTGPSIEAARYAVQVTRRARQRNNLPAAPQLDALWAALSAGGHPASRDEHTGRGGDLLSVSAAAELLGCSNRTVRRLAPKLGGKLVSGRWVLSRQAVAEHIEGAKL